MTAPVDSEVKQRTLSIAVELANRGRVRAEIAEILSYQEARAEGLNPYKSGSLGAYLTEEAKKKISSESDPGEIAPIVDKLNAVFEARHLKADGPAKGKQRITPLARPTKTPAPSVQPLTDNCSVSDVASVIQCDTPPELPKTNPSTEVKKMLAEIFIAERPGDTAPGRKSRLQTMLVAARFPVALIERLDALGGKRSHHLEKALMLYLRAMEEPGSAE